jgi:hypothetical protein
MTIFLIPMFRKACSRWNPGVVIFSLFLFLTPEIFTQEPARKISAFRDSTDHAIDISDWLVNKRGVLLVPSIITEPAVGYGAVAAAIFFHSSYTEKHGPPSMTGAVGGGTQNGTWAAGVFHVGYWKQDRLRYTGALVRTTANLEFYGSGLFLGDEPVNLNLDAWVLFQQLKGRLGETKFFLGGKYLLFDTDNTFEVPVDLPEFSGQEFHSTLSEASILLNYDSRNNVFTPTKGFFLQTSGTYSDTWFGGDGLYGRLIFDAIGYFPVSERVFVGTRFLNNYTLGDVPFYARPTIRLRGVPLVKYQDRNTMEFETEVDVNVTKRWSVLGFTGMGNAYSSLSDFKDGKSVRNLGAGFRYLLIRKFGARFGMDFAFSQDDFAFYFVFGTSWFR